VASGLIILPTLIRTSDDTETLDDIVFLYLFVIYLLLGQIKKRHWVVSCVCPPVFTDRLGWQTRTRLLVEDRDDHGFATFISERLQHIDDLDVWVLVKPELYLALHVLANLASAALCFENLDFHHLPP